ncbi:GH25 family lysozyme [Ruminococcus sp.]|uniref:glycoside hydrolase family 25 protein n=1 Tax=Ruminococcus sp. TaxID=41978 RepID=UPI0025FC784E|nr:GH25 family lysozyme [Ruminococcus sp.]MBQ8966429.1 hypothetical protein [Ruminococcus sp.]
MGNKSDNKKNSFRLSDEARAVIDNEYSQPAMGGVYDFGEDADDYQQAYLPKSYPQRRRRSPAPVYVPQEEYPEEEYEDEEYEEEPRPRKRKKHRLRKLLIRVLVLSLLVIIADIGVLFYRGELWFNQPRKRDYPVRGPVITEKAGAVSWKDFSQQNIQMCYIRATKSTAYEDERFDKNAEGSGQTKLPVGFMHVYDPNMAGEDQAEHFIEVCGNMNGRLRPAVDCDFGLLYKIIPPDYTVLCNELRIFADRIEEEYGCTPIIKCSSKVYTAIAADERFDDCPIWYVSEFSKPDDTVDWELWGYSSRVRFDHYDSHSFLEMVLLRDGEEQLEEMYLN